jgi:hypothetical protein
MTARRSARKDPGIEATTGRGRLERDGLEDLASFVGRHGFDPLLESRRDGTRVGMENFLHTLAAVLHLT